MSELIPPTPAAIAVRRRFDAAEAEVERVAAAMPSAMKIVTGELTDEQRAVLDKQRAELEAAREARWKAFESLQKYKRWTGDGGPLAAEAALRKAAREGDPQDAA
jgi:hypothetical protein